jgi:hypothetical protein
MLEIYSLDLSTNPPPSFSLFFSGKRRYQSYPQVTTEINDHSGAVFPLSVGHLTARKQFNTPMPALFTRKSSVPQVAFETLATTSTIDSESVISTVHLTTYRIEILQSMEIFKQEIYILFRRHGTQPSNLARYTVIYPKVLFMN